MKKYTYLSLFICLLFTNSLWAIGGRTPVYAKNGMVVSSSGIASQVGRDALQNGGNAVDAAVATAFALAVTLPSAGNIGGGGFMICYSKDGAATAIDFREKAPLNASKEMYLGNDGNIKDNSNHEGLLSVGVPGTVAGLYLAHQKYGSKPWPELVQPAIDLARDGFEFTWTLHNHTSGYLVPWLDKYPSTAKILLKNGFEPYEPGEIWRQPELAETLTRIQEQGHDGFYHGQTAEQLAIFMKENGGIITEKDLAAYRAVERVPVHGTYRGYDIYAMPPPSSGGVALVEMLNILEGYDIADFGHNSARYLHLLTETMRRAFADRAIYLGDPDFNPGMPVDKLISKVYADSLRRSINLTVASISDSARFNDFYESPETTHFSVIDSSGNAVSLTYTLEQGYGSKIVAEGLGFLLNNEMGDFNAVPGLTNNQGVIGTQPNQIAPEKRMLSSMTPAVVTRNGKPVILIGSPGGRTIINTVLQVILNVIDFDLNIARAIEAGRIHHQWLPDVTVFEDGAISADTRTLFEDMGHKVKTQNSQGQAMGIHINRETGIISGAADSRSPDGGVSGF